MTENIHLHYRAADFTKDDHNEISERFVKSERVEITENQIAAVSNLPEQLDESESLNNLANQFAAIMRNPNLPRDIYNVLTDEFARVIPSTDTPENILLNLKALSDAEKREQTAQESKNA